MLLKILRDGAPIRLLICQMMDINGELHVKSTIVGKDCICGTQDYSTYELNGAQFNFRSLIYHLVKDKVSYENLIVFRASLMVNVCYVNIPQLEYEVIKCCRLSKESISKLANEYAEFVNSEQYKIYSCNMGSGMLVSEFYSNLGYKQVAASCRCFAVTYAGMPVLFSSLTMAENKFLVGVNTNEKSYILNVDIHDMNAYMGALTKYRVFCST